MIDKNEPVCLIENHGYEVIEKAIGMIGGKWKLRILYILSNNKLLRYGELKRRLTPITHKMMSTQLKELERDGLIIRKEYPQVPPKVEYSLSPNGWGLAPVYLELAKWVMVYSNDLET